MEADDARRTGLAAAQHEVIVQQDVMHAWRDWIMSHGVSAEIADRLLDKGYVACALLWEVAYARG